jgi:hypothetical protein
VRVEQEQGEEQGVLGCDRPTSHSQTRPQAHLRERERGELELFQGLELGDARWECEGVS